jgi:hypothetical protein
VPPYTKAKSELGQTREPLSFTTIAHSQIREPTEIGLSSISGAFFGSFFGETKKEKKRA